MKKIITWVKNNKLISSAVALLLLASLTILVIGNSAKLFGVAVLFESNISDSDFVILTPKGEEIKSFSAPANLSLVTGEYYVKPKNSETYSMLPKKIIVDKKPLTIELDFNFSLEHYDSYFDEDRKAISKQLTDRYEKLLSNNNFSIDEGYFFDKGVYYATSIGLRGNIVRESGQDIVVLEENRFIGNVYRVIFQKVNSEWKQVTHPELILSAVEYYNVPLHIIQEVNTWWR